MDYWLVKLRALTILDSETSADLVTQYEKKYSAKTQLYLGLNISSNKMATLAPDVNKDLKLLNPKSKSLTNAALSSCKTVADFITKYCGAAGAAGVALEKGEPT